MPAQLETSLCGIRLKNPVLAASGTFGYGLEFASLLNLNALGGIITKGLSAAPIAGNPAPRLWHTETGMINSVGLQNVGVEVFVRDKLPKLRGYSVPIFTNVFGYRVEDYLAVLARLEDAEGIAAYELNISCPNTKEGGIFFSSSPAATYDLVARARKAAKRPLLVKLSPNVASIQPFVTAVEEAGADCISLVNTFISLALDNQTRSARIGAGFGGLSGPGIRPVAVRLVYEAAQIAKIPIVGLGGICNGRDAAEFLIAGASAVQVGTATFIDPRAPLLVAEQLRNEIARLGAPDPGSLVGSVRPLRPAASKTECKIER
ncbi:MAG: dihydroorotate dehydrogenase [Bryobacteraceae bacterium]